MSERYRSVSLRVSLVSICAALYAIIGYLSHLGLFTPVIGVVRFWPSVFVPAVFAIAFDPWIGGVGAAIGIFISDMIIHGNPLLSLAVGVPANFLGFYIIGKLYQANLSGYRLTICVFIELLVTLIIAYVSYYSGLLQLDIVIATLVTFIITLALSIILKGYERKIVFAGSTGLMVGSAIIGVGVWAFSQAFLLPSGERNLPLWAALTWFVWTYVTEIPFIAILVPPIIRALKKIRLA